MLLGLNDQVCTHCKKSSGGLQDPKKGWLVLYGGIMELGEKNLVAHDMKVVDAPRPIFFCGMICLQLHMSSLETHPSSKTSAPVGIWLSPATFKL